MSDSSIAHNKRPTLSSLPTVLKHRIASYLEHRDVLRLLSENERAENRPFKQLCVAALPPQELFFSQIFRSESSSLSSSDDDTMLHRERIPILTKNSHLHSVRLTCQYQDQGYGEQLGRLCIVARSKADETTTSDRPADRVVYTSPPAPHQYTHLEVSFYPKENEIYEIRFLPGRPGHLLMIENMLIHTIVMDDHDHTIETVYERLCNFRLIDAHDDKDDEGDWPVMNQPNLVFGTKLLVAASETLRDNVGGGDSHYAILKKFFESRKLPVDSMDDVVKVCQFFLLHVDHQPEDGGTCSHIQELRAPSPPQPVDATTNKTLPPFTILAYGLLEGSAEEIMEVARDVRVPLVPGATQSIRLTGKYTVEGAGEAQISLLSPPVQSDPSANSDQRISHRIQIMALQQQTTTLNFSFVPESDVDAYLLRLTGNNCIVQVEDLTVHVTLQVETGHHLEATFLALQERGVLEASTKNRALHLSLLQAVIVYILGSNRSTSNLPLGSFLASHGFPMSTTGLTTLGDMVRNLIEFYEERESTTAGPGMENKCERTDMLYRAHAVM